MVEELIFCFEKQKEVLLGLQGQYLAAVSVLLQRWNSTVMASVNGELSSQDEDP